MTERTRTWVNSNLLLTLLCGVLLMYFPWEGKPLWELLYRDDVSAFPVFLAVTLTFFIACGRHSIYQRSLSWLAKRPATIGLAVFVLLSLLSPLIYQGKPLSTDEYLLWFQAHTFAQGHLFATYPPEWLHHLLISQDLFITDWGTGRILSPYWPGFSLLLSPFAALGIPWLCNPAIVAMSVIVLAAIARDLFEEDESRGLVLLLALASPCFLLNGVTFYAMPAHLLFNAVFTWLVLRPSVPRLAMAGIVGSFALVLHNPLPHILYALPWILWIAVPRPTRWRHLAALVIGYLPISILLGVGWAILRLNSSCPFPCQTGGVLPIVSATDQAGGLATFASSSFVFPTFNILEWRVVGGVKLLLSSTPAIVLLACFAPLKSDKRLRTLAASAVLTFAGYFLISADQGFGWGYRYFHSAWFTLPILATATARRWQNAEPGAPDSYLIARSAFLSLLLIVPFKAFIMFSYTREHWSRLPPHDASPNEIVFKGPVGSWGLLLVQNPPDLSGSPTVFVSLGRRRDEEFLRKYFPDAQLSDVNAFGTTYRSLSSPPKLRLQNELAGAHKTGD